MGLLAWSPEPGDEGLLLFPGEQDDVTKDKERQKQGQNNAAGSGDIRDTALPTHNFLMESPKGTLPPPICPPSTMSIARPTHEPILGGALISSTLCSPGPQSSVAGSGSPRLAKCRGQMPKTILLWDTPWAGGGKNMRLRKGKGTGGSKPESTGASQNLTFSYSTKKTHMVPLKGTIASSGPALAHPDTHFYHL